jgi:hypothetical protein
MHMVATSGTSSHPIVKFNGRKDSRVTGTVFEITDAELARADQYEVVALQTGSRDTRFGETGVGVC